MVIGTTGNSARRAIGACIAALGIALSSCGGGTGQIEPFQPRRIIVLGDETAGLTADGKRYAINGLDANAAIDCTQLPLWTQSIVTAFGMVLDRCNPTATTNVLGSTRAAPNAKAAELVTQVDAELAAGPLTNKDLFLVMVGMHDVIERFEAGAGCDDGELRARGQLVAAQINRLIAAGGRVIVSTVHDLGLSPYARVRNQTALITCLTDTYNARVRVDIVQDGRFVGLVLADDTIRLAVKEPGGFAGLVNVIDAACSAPLPDCTAATLVAGATATSNLWADELHFGQAAHTRLAVLGETRARNNPF